MPTKLLDCFVELSSNKERTTLEKSVVKTICELLKCDVHLLHLYNGAGEFLPEIRLRGNSAGEVSFDNQSLDDFSVGLLEKIIFYLPQLKFDSDQVIAFEPQRYFWPLFSAEQCIDLIVINQSTVVDSTITVLTAMGRIFANFISLLDAGERDALTGLYNRRLFDTRLSSLIRKSNYGHHCEAERRHPEEQLGNYLGIIDIDFFKRVNDNYGHLFGDEVLLWLAQQMRHCFRNEDALFRYGGEEFAVLLVGLEQPQAQDTFERFGRTIANSPFPQIGKITVSIGYCFIDHQANPTLVFGHADKALYYAKQHGRDRVDCYHRLLSEGLIDVEQPDNVDIEIF